MFMPCPHCGFLVALILPSQATAPDGAAPRCPRCDGILGIDGGKPIDPTDSDAGAGNMPPASTDDSGAEHPDGATSTPSGAGAADRAEPPQVDARVAAPGAETADPGADPGAHPPGRARRARRVPSFVRGTTPAKTPRIAWPWYAAIALLGLLLALQLLLAQRHELAASARWRPWVEALCTRLPCDIPPWREPQAFTMLERSVRPDPGRPGVLAVEANFRNDARWPQPWPTLVLSLSDVEGRQVGLRAFAPADYREGPVGAGDRLAPGQSASVRLLVREPVPRIVAFTFDFQ